MPSKEETRFKYYGTRDRWTHMCMDHERMQKPPSTARRDWDGWVKTEFPYFVPENELPAPLPTAEEIQAAKGTKDELTGRFALNPVLRVSGVYAVKRSAGVAILQEAENLLFLEKHSKIRVPKVYAAYREPGSFNGKERTYNYLVMEYIPGTPCGAKWPELNPTARHCLHRKLSEQVQLLREVPAPSPAYYGRIHYQSWTPYGFTLTGRRDDEAPHGPFDTHQEWLDALFESSERVACSWRHPAPDFTEDQAYCLQAFHQKMAEAAGTQPVLTHLDMKMDNIMVIDKEGTKDEVDVVIIDWAWMGWMPAYMETARSVYWGSCREVEWVEEHFAQMTKHEDPSHVETARFVRRFLDATGNSWAC